MPVQVKDEEQDQLLQFFQSGKEVVTQMSRAEFIEEYYDAIMSGDIVAGRRIKQFITS